MGQVTALGSALARAPSSQVDPPDGVQRSLDQAVAAPYLSRTTKEDKLDWPRLPWLEADGGAGRDSQATPIGARAVESVTTPIKLTAPLVVGVPVIAPVVPFRLSPEGNAPIVE